jgi:23S rRNA pseudouridine2605 synthase
MRLNRFLALCGVASRRASEQWITAGRVRVNGAVAADLATTVDPRRDRVTVDGRRIEPPREATYVILHKPRGYVTTLRDPHGRPTVRDLLPPGSPRLYPVGRLDADSEGLLLLTDDGRLAFRLMHPRYEVPRTYRVTVEGRPDEKEIESLREGVMLEDGSAAASRVLVVRTSDRGCQIEITIHEGRKREIRRMMEAIGHRVTRLVRTAYGPLSLGDLAPGRTRRLTLAEAAALRKSVRLG